MDLVATLVFQFVGVLVLSASSLVHESIWMTFILIISEISNTATSFTSCVIQSHNNLLSKFDIKRNVSNKGHLFS